MATIATDQAAPLKRSASSKDANEDADDLCMELSSDIQGILAALQQVRQKAHNDGAKRNKEILDNLSADIKSQLDAKRQKIEKDWQSLVKSTTKLCKEYESALQGEFAKYQAARERFLKEKASHMQAYEDVFTKFGEEKEKLNSRFEQQRKKDKASLGELQKFFEEKIGSTEQSLKKNKQHDKSFSILRKSLDSFLSNNSDDDIDE